MLRILSFFSFFIFATFSKLFQLDIIQGVSYSLYILVVIHVFSIVCKLPSYIGYWPSLKPRWLNTDRDLFTCSWTGVQAKFIHEHASKGLCQYPAILTEFIYLSLVRKVFIMWHTGHKFLAGHSGQSKKANIAPSCHYVSQLQCRMWFILYTCTTSRVIKFKVIPQK